MRVASVLPVNYLDRWSDLARWAVRSRHGAAARFSIMFSLTLRWAPVADRAHIQLLRPRVWRVVAPTGDETQRVALFDDNLMEELLDTVEATTGLSSPVYPRTPCGSQAVDIWAHSMASRRGHRGCKNFAAMSDRFGIALNTWSPLEIYVASLSTFRASFDWEQEPGDTLLSRQLGSHPRHAYYALHWIETPPGLRSVGSLRVHGGETIFVAPAPPC